MGHIVNAKSMRVGWCYSWSDQWYTELQYYPEYLHAIFRIRFYLVYYFTDYSIEKRGYFYSHFEIINYYKKLYISVFLYDGMSEGHWEELIFFRLWTKMLDFKAYDPEERKPSEKFLSIFKVIIYFALLTHNEPFNIDDLQQDKISSLLFYKLFKAILKKKLSFLKYFLTFNNKNERLIQETVIKDIDWLTEKKKGKKLKNLFLEYEEKKDKKELTYKYKNPFFLVRFLFLFTIYLFMKEVINIGFVSSKYNFDFLLRRFFFYLKL